MDTKRATQARYSPPCPTSGNATHMSHWDLRRCGKQNAAAGRMKSGSAAGGDRRSAIAARCRGTGARQSAKHSGRRDASYLDRLADYFHAPLHRSRIRWFVLMSHLDVLRDFQACSLCIHSAYNEVFSLQLAEVRTAFSWTQLSRTHTLMSYAETIFEDLRKPKELKISTPLPARNRKKTPPTRDFQKPRRVRTPAAGVQDFDSTG